MSHIARHKIGIKDFNMEVMKKAMELAEKNELKPYVVDIIEDAVFISGFGLYRAVRINKDGTIEYDDMNSGKAREIEETVKKYYIAIASMIALQNMGYDVEYNITKDGRIQVLGVS